MDLRSPWLLHHRLVLRLVTLENKGLLYGNWKLLFIAQLENKIQYIILLTEAMTQSLEIFT